MTSNLLQRTFLALSALTGLMTIISIASLPHHINPDMGMYIEIGQKVLDGEHSYVDYEEINFPMIHWLNVLPAAISRLTGLAPTITFHLCIFTLMIASYGLIWHLMPKSRVAATGIIFGLISVSWILVFIFQWGQREHLFVLLYLPFLVIRVERRNEEESKNYWTALLVGVLAGMGIAIKPHFALIAVLVELAGLIVSCRWFILKPEIFGVSFIAVLNLAYFALHPNVLGAFITLIGRLQEGYGAYAAIPWTENAVTFLAGLGTGSFGVLLACFQSKRLIGSAGLWNAIGAMAISSVLAVVLQGKLWTYHTIPIIFVTFILFVLILLQKLISYPILGLSRLLIFITVCLLICLGILQQVGLQDLANVFERDGVFALEFYVETYTSPNDRVMVIDTSTLSTYPMLLTLQRRSASRYAMAHPFPIAYYPYQVGRANITNDETPAYMQDYLDALIWDMARHEPKIVFIRSLDCRACSLTHPNLYNYLEARGVLADVIDPDYDLLTVDNGFHIYVRKGTAPNP